jgi:hypothetical protein
MTKSKVLVIALLAAFAAAGAGWKWTRAHPVSTNHQRVAGWTWDRKAG